MHNTYFSSTIYAIRSKGSFSLSFNDYSNCLYERLDRTPSRLSSSSSCCHCCDCCAISTYRVPITPSLLCGLRQSTLLQWSCSRRLILSGGDRYFSRLPVYSPNRCCCELNCSVKERSVCDRRRRIKGRCFCTVSEEKSKISHSGGYDEAEAVLSLLSEEAGGDSVCVRGKNVSSFKRLGVEKKRIIGSRERNLSSGKKVEVEVEKKGNLKNQETSTVDLRKEDEEHNEEKEAFMKGENRRKRRDASSCSSYYSFSSSGDFESDLEVQDKHGQNVEELSVGYEENKTSHLEGQVMEAYDRQREDPEKLEEISNQERTRFDSDIDWNLRKKTEKRLTEESMDETESRKESENMHSRVSRMHDSNYGKASVSHKRFDSEQANSSSAMGLNKKTKKENIQDKERTSKFQGTEQQQLQKREKIISQVEERRRSQQISELSEVHESDVELENTSILKSRTRVKNWEENSNLGSDASGLYVQTDKRTQQTSQPRKGSELINPVSEAGASNEKNVSSSQRTSDKVRFSQKSNLTSGVITRDSYCQTDERVTKFKSSSEAQRPTNLSFSTETGSREAASFQGSLNLISEATEQHIILVGGDERSSQLMPIPSSSQLMARGSAHVEPTTGIASPDVYPETSESGSSALYNNSGRRSPALLSEPYSGDASDQVYSAPSHIASPEDALGSADRLEKSSKQFVDDFVEKVRHEVTTSEIQGMEVTGANLAASDQMDSLRHGTQNGSQLKEHESSHSSEFSGTKGPSDEMWDVTEPSVKQNPTAEESEDIKATRKSIVKRTGRSLWSVMGDVVRLRWGSRSNASTSASRSGERSSSNRSDSETWLSGQEHEETSKSNVGKERTSVQQQATTSDQLQTGKLPTQIEGEVVDTMKLKDKAKHLEVSTSSSPHILESGSTSIGMSFASKEENTWTEDGKNLQGTASGVGTMELSNPLPVRGPPLVEEIVNTGSSDMLRTKSVMPTEEPVAPTQAASPGTVRKDGELKQRKFQRNKQVLRDRFDEWEEAYKLEHERRNIDEVFMREALLEAKKAADTWEVPVGAVLVQHGKIIARGCNLVEELRDSTAHAEMICIREASNLLRSWRLADSTLYVTLEPCPMCAGAILQARIENLVWGAPNKLLGADGSWIRLFPDGGENSSELKDKPPAPVHPFHPKMKIRRGVLAAECADVMQQFFQLRRKKKTEEPQNEPSCLPVSHHPSKFFNKMHDIFNIMFCL